MSPVLSETPEEIRAVAEKEAVGTDLTKKQIDKICEVSVSSDEARNRVRAIVEGRIEEGDEEHLTEGRSEEPLQAHEVEQAAQGDREMQAAEFARLEGEDPGKAVKEAKKEAEAG